MKQMTIGKRIFTNSGFLCLVIAGLCIFSVSRLLSLQTVTTNLAEDSLPGIMAASEINSVQADNMLLLYSMMLSSNSEERQKLKTAIGANKQRNEKALEAYKVTADEPDNKILFNELQAQRASFLKIRDQFFSMVETNQMEAQAFMLNTLRPGFLNYKKAGDALVTYNATQGHANSNFLTATVSSAIKLIIISGILSLLIGISLSIINLRKIVRALKTTSEVLSESANQFTAASDQISTASQFLAEGASEQAASIEETSASLEEISSMTKSNSDNAGKANDLTKQARKAADTGSADMEAMNTAMEGIKDSSNDIAKIIKTIDEIAFQTNILALNAAVEAARAGEQGMGFAVVADEVRNLAQRSAGAAKETAAKIEGAIARSEQGVLISSKVAKTLQEIVEKVRQVDLLISEVATASKEQTQGIEQISCAVNQMDKVTQSNAANAEESASASAELNAQAKSLHHSVGDLLELIGSDATEKSEKEALKYQPKATALPKHASLSKTAVNTAPQNHQTRTLTLSAASTAKTNANDLFPMDDFKDQ